MLKWVESQRAELARDPPGSGSDRVGFARYKNRPSQATNLQHLALASPPLPHFPHLRLRLRLAAGDRRRSPEAGHRAGEIPPSPPPSSPAPAACPCPAAPRLWSPPPLPAWIFSMWRGGGRARGRREEAPPGEIGREGGGGGGCGIDPEIFFFFVICLDWFGKFFWGRRVRFEIRFFQVRRLSHGSKLLVVLLLVLSQFWLQCDLW